MHSEQRLAQAGEVKCRLFVNIFVESAKKILVNKFAIEEAQKNRFAIHGNLMFMQKVREDETIQRKLNSTSEKCFTVEKLFCKQTCKL